MIFKLSLRNLSRNRRRTAAVLLTLATGTAAMFIFHGFNAGIMNQYRDGTIRARYGHGQLNEAGYRDQHYEKPWEHWVSDVSALGVELRKDFPGILLFPRVEFFGLLSTGSVTVSGKGQGVDGAAESQFFTKMNISSGQPLAAQADGILLGQGIARSLNVKEGDRITLVANTIFGSMNAIDTQVVGVFHTGLKEFDDTFFRIQLKEAQRLLDTDRVESVVLGLERLDQWAEVAAWAKKNRPDLDATPFAVLDKVYYQNSVDFLDSQFQVIQTIILVMVLLGIFTTVSSVILERKTEIGNLRANGESIPEILSLLLAEGAWLGIFGTALGIGIALLLANVFLANGILMPPAPGITRQFTVKIQLQALMALKAATLGMGTALLATLIAAYRVARQPIADLLRAAG